LADGVQAITVFGSVARDDASDASDVDLAIRVGAGFSSGGFDYFGRMEALRERLCDLLGRDVDVVEETTVSPRLREAIQRDGVRAF
jgi:predicted nucleotidyltransferase